MARRARRRRNGGRELDWRTLIRRIKAGKFTPIISYRVSGGHFSDQDHVAESWAKEVGYPLIDLNNLSRVAQYATVTSPDVLSAKEDFLFFLKERLLDNTRTQNPDADSAFLDTLEDELDDLTFSEIASRLGYPSYEDEFKNPLRILAELPIPVYVTSNFATFMEEALKGAGKTPRSEICYWHENLADEFPSVFEEDPDYQPSEEEPLVFHIHGIDSIAGSLVLTEDDFLDFLVRVSEDPDVIPKRVSQALVDSSLLLVGYELKDWDFRTIFRGLITSKRASRRMLSVTLQIEPDKKATKDPEEAQTYLQRYFENLNFEIYWGDTQNFLQELWEQWES